jgi:hypothetical protein
VLLEGGDEGEEADMRNFYPDARLIAKASWNAST